MLKASLISEIFASLPYVLRMMMGGLIWVRSEPFWTTINLLYETCVWVHTSNVSTHETVRSRV